MSDIAPEQSKVDPTAPPVNSQIEQPAQPDPAPAPTPAEDAERLRLIERLERLEKRSAERPKPTRDQIAEALGLMGEATEQRDDAKQAVIKVQELIDDLERRQREADIREAAAAARFSDPMLAVEILAAQAGSEGFDAKAAVAALAERAPGLLASPGGGRTPDLGSGNGTQPGGGGQTVAERLAAEIDAEIAKSPYAKFK